MPEHTETALRVYLLRLQQRRLAVGLDSIFDANHGECLGVCYPMATARVREAAGGEGS